MRYSMLAVSAALMAACLTGCADGVPGPTPGQSRVLDNVNYTDAFATAQAVFARTFEIASSDSESGEIRSQPLYVNASGDRVIGNSPARQLATMQLTRTRGQIVARLVIIQQRQGAAVRNVMAPPGMPYSSVPDETPAEDTGATTPEQNSSWQNERRVSGLEARMLQELYDALHPQPTSTCATSQP
jgi:hypothetical protein